ncbi:MAG: DUF971 domain-containing protein [Gammaproteobacteria bacterium]|nr:DUF971 domain-containing protein [Gammaproteobacteria bacterium]
MTATSLPPPVPVEIKLSGDRRQLTVVYDDGHAFDMSSEYLRVYSPSAEVRGHGKGEGTLQLGKQDVTITAIEPVGNYAVRLIFSDRHSTGLFTWRVLHDLGSHRDELWLEYLDRVAAAASAGVTAPTLSCPRS